MKKQKKPETTEEMYARLKIGPHHCYDCVAMVATRTLCHQCWIQTPDGAHRNPKKVKK